MLVVLVQFGEIWHKRTLRPFLFGKSSSWKLLPSHRCSLHHFSIRIFPAESNQVSVALSPLQVKPHDSRRLRAIELSVPNVIATFQVKHRNADGVITDARVYNIDLNAGKVLFTLA